MRHRAPPSTPHELGAGGRVVQHPQHADEVGDHRLVEQPGEAEHVRGHAVGAQRGGEHVHVREGAAQQGAGGRRAPPGAPSRAANQRATWSASSSMVSRPGGLDAAGAGERRGCQRRLRDARVERRDEGVGGVEHDARVAPARREVVHAGRGARLGEVAREAREVGGARAAPSVDRLVGVADGHHRVPAEQRREQAGLHHARVLVLVEQHGAGAFAVGGDHLGMPFADREREGDLVGELDVAALALRRGIGVGEVEQRRERAHHPERIGEACRSRCACGAPRSAGPAWRGSRERTPARRGCRRRSRPAPG